MVMSFEHSPSPLIVTSPYEWTIPEWDQKPKTKKNKKIDFNKHFYFFFYYETVFMLHVTFIH